MKGNDRYLEWLQVAGENPFLEARLGRGLTQEQVAKSIDVSVQYIRRHEQGTINTPSGSLLNHLGVHPFDFDNWQLAMRKLVEPALRDMCRGITYMDIAVSPEHPFLACMEASVRRIGSYFDIPFKASDNEFTKFTVQHPRNWQLYVKSGKADMNPELARVCYNVGIPSKDIEEGVRVWLTNQ